MKTSALAGAGMMFFPGCGIGNQGIPSYLKNYSREYNENPRRAAIEWFRDANYGMFIHYGLYSLLADGEWVQLRSLIPVAEYAKLKDRFTAEKFDADRITDIALEGEMKYINITTRHHDSFCLWDTKYKDFKSTNSPAKRDLIAELYEQCNKKGLALFLYYSHGRDWRHPHAPNNDHWGANARPAYNPPEAYYKYGEEHDLNIYIEFMFNQVKELMEMFPLNAGIWLDGIGVPRTGDYNLFRCEELYEMIHSRQPHALISYKQGLLGTEDFLAPERHFDQQETMGKPLELCDTLQERRWGYAKEEDGKHKKKADVLKMIQKAKEYPANLLLNTGPLPSGEMHPEDVDTYLAVGKEIRSRGWEGI